MTNEEIQNIINQLEDKDLKHLASFGLFDTTHGYEYSLQANKEGIQLFVLALLKVLQQTENNLLDKEKNIIQFPSNSEWVNPKSDILIAFVELIDKRPENIEDKPQKETLSDKFFMYGFLTILVILLIAMFVGLGTLAKWIF